MLITHGRVAVAMLIVSVFVFVTCFQKAFCIPLNDFFPFGTTQSDLALPRNDDRSSSAITLSVAYPYFDANYRVVYVSNYMIRLSIDYVSVVSSIKC